MPLGTVWQCQGTEGVVGAQPASVFSCPSVCPYPRVHADLAHPEAYPCFPVRPCPHPLPTIVCAPTPWVCTPKHPPLHTHMPIAGVAWLCQGVLLSQAKVGMSQPCHPPCCAGPRGEQGWGRWLYWGDSPRESPESSTRAGQGGGGCVPVLGSGYGQGHTVTQWSGRAAGSCWWQGCPLALEEPLG